MQTYFSNVCAPIIKVVLRLTEEALQQETNPV